jgi:hypothetical protein
MKKIILISMFAAIALSFLTVAKPAAADMAWPSATKIYFTQGGQPYNSPVDFSLKCYGYTYFDANGNRQQIREPGTYTPELLISYGPYKYDKYGFEIDGSNYFSTKQGNIDYCDVYGNTQGQDFVIKNQAVNMEKDCQMSSPSGSDSTACSLTMNIPDLGSATNNSANIVPQPNTNVNPIVIVQPKQENLGYWARLWKNIKCFFLAVFNKTC